MELTHCQHETNKGQQKGQVRQSSGHTGPKQGKEQAVGKRVAQDDRFKRVEPHAQNRSAQPIAWHYEEEELEQGVPEHVHEGNANIQYEKQAIYRQGSQKGNRI